MDAKNWRGNLMGVMGEGEENVWVFEWNALQPLSGFLKYTILD